MHIMSMNKSLKKIVLWDLKSPKLKPAKKLIAYMTEEN